MAKSVGETRAIPRIIVFARAHNPKSTHKYDTEVLKGTFFFSENISYM